MGLNTGPFIKVACFCENAIEGKDGVFTLVRIVDVVTHEELENSSISRWK